MGEARLRNEPAMPKELDGAETFVLIDNVSDGMSNRHVSCWLQADMRTEAPESPLYPQDRTFKCRCPVSRRSGLIWALPPMARAFRGGARSSLPRAPPGLPASPRSLKKILPPRLVSGVPWPLSPFQFLKFFAGLG